METPIYDSIIRNINSADELIFGNQLRQLMGFSLIEDEQNKNCKQFFIIESLREARVLIGSELEAIYINDIKVFERLANRLLDNINVGLRRAKSESRVFKQVLDCKVIEIGKQGRKLLKRNGYKLSTFAYKASKVEDNYKRAHYQYEKQKEGDVQKGYDLDYIPNVEEREKTIKRIQVIEDNLNQPVTKEQYIDLYAIVLDKLYEVVYGVVNNLLPKDEIIRNNDIKKVEETAETLFNLEGYNEKLLFIKHSGIFDGLKSVHKKNNGEPHYTNISKIITYITGLDSVPTIKGKLGFLENPEKAGANNPYNSKSVFNTIKALDDAGITDEWLLSFSKKYYNK